MESTLSEYLQSQEELVKEAALALPHSFSQCTYPLGPLRQAVYLCTSCPEPRGICSACSIACHTDHEQVELFPKRGFRCDCPTSAVAHPCTLNPALQPENTENSYGQNFQGLFCRCGRPYDARTERETMIQCLACEDWFHESCCNLRVRPSSRDPSPDPAQDSHQPQPHTQTEGDNIDDSLSDASSSGLPPPLINGDEYESFVCSACVMRSPILKRWAGTFGTIMVVRDNSGDPWRRLNGVPMDPESPIDVQHNPHASGSGVKRPSSPSNLTEPEPKRAKYSSQAAQPRPPCLAPVQPQLAVRILEGLTAENGPTDLGTGDLFLTEGFRDRWCHCSTCQLQLETEPWLLQDEETYEPPEDPDSGLSLEELGMRALERIPRDRAIDGIHAFNKLRGDLLQFLRPFAQEGKVVNEADVKQFFDNLAEASKQDRK